MRWRLGVDGAWPLDSIIESRVSVSLMDLRRLLEPREGACGI